MIMIIQIFMLYDYDYTNNDYNKQNNDHTDIYNAAIYKCTVL